MERLLRVPRIVECKLDSTEHTGGINHPDRVVFDMRLNLRRLPHNSRDDAKTKIYIAVHNGHAYSFKNWEQARNIMRTSLSYFEACLKAAAWPDKV